MTVVTSVVYMPRINYLTKRLYKLYNYIFFLQSFLLKTTPGGDFLHFME